MARTSVRCSGPDDQLSDPTIDERPAFLSIIGELETVTWYHQRADGTQDRDLAAYISSTSVATERFALP